MGELLGVGPIYGPVGGGASLIAVGGPPDVSGSRKAFDFFAFLMDSWTLNTGAVCSKNVSIVENLLTPRRVGPPAAPGSKPLQAR